MRTNFIPSEGEALSVSLPSETIRATVVRVINRDMIEAELNLAQPFTRLHGYDMGQRLKFKRQSDVLGEKWLVVPGQPKGMPVKEGPKARVAPPDEKPAVPERPKIKAKAQRRSDVEIEKPRRK